ncbi:MAG: tyrosine-type recombinase/integrase [Pirellulales bacterium]
MRSFAEGGYRRARPDLRPASLTQILLAVDLLELWHGGAVYCDQLCRDFLLDFRAWRLATRPLPPCTEHRQAMRLLGGTRYRCPVKACPATAAYVAAVGHATANKNVRTLVALWYEAVDQGLNPHTSKERIRPLKEELDNLPCWEPGDFSKILASCRVEPRIEELPCDAGAFWFALLLTVYDTGSRISAIMDCTPADLDWQAKTLTLRAGTTKSRKCQVMGLSDQTLEAIRAISDPARGYLFPWPFGRAKRDWRTLRTRYKSILQRAGLPKSKIHLFHKVRRTTATELVLAGGLAAAREHLGHSAESVTKRYIDRRRLDSTQRNARLLPRPRTD